MKHIKKLILISLLLISGCLRSSMNSNSIEWGKVEFKTTTTVTTTITTIKKTPTTTTPCICPQTTCPEQKIYPKCEDGLTEITADKLMNLRIEGKIGVSAYSGGFMKCKKQVLEILGLKYIPGSTVETNQNVPPVWYGVPVENDNLICFPDTSFKGDKTQFKLNNTSWS